MATDVRDPTPANPHDNSATWVILLILALAIIAWATYGTYYHAGYDMPPQQAGTASNTPPATTNQ